MIIRLVFVVLAFAGYCLGLQCYACFGTGKNNECEKYQTYQDAMDGKKEHLKKNCSAPYDAACITHTYENNGQRISHIRDCSDGQSFSFTGTDEDIKGAYYRLKNLEINNETACVWDAKFLVCLSKCNEDFCNGPVFIDRSGYGVIRPSVIFYCLLQVLVFVM